MNYAHVSYFFGIFAFFARVKLPTAVGHSKNTNFGGVIRISFVLLASLTESSKFSSSQEKILLLS